MKTAILAGTFATLAGFIMAAPAPEATVPVRAVNRQWTPYVYACITTGWQHYSLSKGDDFFESITGFGPDQGINCSLYSQTDCNGDHLDNIVYPGIGDLHDKGWNDRAQSYRCM
ncbi:hypothetical protein B0T20DRAFT_506739 [Sordaria brevicollis]|uniref:Uncharacterized protein n=1 Tax=Sordaria brevicollis TaxID=83679 RepID=A0AAE0PDV9_SORBR|nr:hypothetical protein B0T20DRAFT_506739 [Sordaria brevicollis]